MIVDGERFQHICTVDRKEDFPDDLPEISTKNSVSAHGPEDLPTYDEALQMGNSKNEVRRRISSQVSSTRLPSQRSINSEDFKEAQA